MTRFLFRHSAAIFAVFTILALVAFWRNYLGRLDAPHGLALHAHAAAMFAWCALLIAQGSLIRLKRPAWHAWLGRASYALVPLILVSGWFVSMDSIAKVAADPVLRDARSALMIHSLIAFAAIFALGMRARRDPAIHARYMVGTLFPMVTPVTDRLIFHHLPSLVPYLPTLEGRPRAYTAGFLLADAVLIALLIADWKNPKTRHVFAVVLAIVLAYQASVVWHAAIV